MRSVADIPGDADDDLAEISPELVLVDPELARRMREDAAATAAAEALAQERALRLVQRARADDAAPTILDRASSGTTDLVVPRPAAATGSAAPTDRGRSRP